MQGRAPASFAASPASLLALAYGPPMAKPKHPPGPMTLGKLRREKGGSKRKSLGARAAYQARPRVLVGEGRVSFRDVRLHHARA